MLVKIIGLKYFKKNMEDPKIENYFIRKYPNGVYCLTFCMNERGVHYNMISDTTLVFGDEFIFFEIEPFLPTDIKFTRADQQCKNQISIYYIPLEDRGEVILDKKLN